MCVSRHEIVNLLISAFYKDAEKASETLLNILDLIQEPETHICGHLIVPRASCVQLSTQRTDNLPEAAFVGGVDIFVVFLRDELGDA